MATTMFFEKTLQDYGKPDVKVNLEFGRMSHYGDNLMYFVIDGKTICVDHETGRKIYKGMQETGIHLGYDD